MGIDPASNTPLYQQVAADLRRRIIAGEMAVGSQLQTHRQLASHYDVSIITINKALAGLVSEGVLYSRVGRGTFVVVRPAPATGVATDRMLAFVLRDLSSPVFSLIAHAAQERADAHGYSLLFSSSSNRLDREEEQIQRFRDLGAQGLIIVSMSRTYQLSDSMRARCTSPAFLHRGKSYTEGDDVPFIGLPISTKQAISSDGIWSRSDDGPSAAIADKFGSQLAEARARGYRRAAAEHGFTISIPPSSSSIPMKGNGTTTAPAMPLSASTSRP